MNLSPTLSKNHRLAPLKWKKSTPHVSDSVMDKFSQASQTRASRYYLRQRSLKNCVLTCIPSRNKQARKSALKKKILFEQSEFIFF